MLWASTQETLSSGFAAILDTSQLAQRRRLDKLLKYRLMQDHVFYFQKRANNKFAGQTARVRRLIYDCCCHATKLDFLATMSIVFTLKNRHLYFISRLPCQNHSL